VAATRKPQRPRSQCAALLFSEQDQLLDTMWSRWEDEYDLGGLADLACRQVGRCGAAAGPTPDEL